MRGLSFEATVVRLVLLAAARGGAVAPADVEQDDLLARDRGTTSAAARLLASGTDVVATPATERAHRLPYAQLTFTPMRAADAAGRE